MNTEVFLVICSVKYEGDYVVKATTDLEVASAWVDHLAKHDDPDNYYSVETWPLTTDLPT